MTDKESADERIASQAIYLTGAAEERADVCSYLLRAMVGTDELTARVISRLVLDIQKGQHKRGGL